MKDIVKYVMGEAAKSNIEKRQVGCVIVDLRRNTIVAAGHNTEDVHAEVMAINSFTDDGGDYQLYVSHPPCPECARLLADHGFTNVKVVDAFQKFDGDKLRYDLIDGTFIHHVHYNFLTAPTKTFYYIREALWKYGADPKPEPGKLSHLIEATHLAFDHYKDFRAFEDALARVLTFGARKYKANNWKKCEDTGRYLAAAHRHLIAKIDGEDCDPETGFDHLDHVITNLMFLYVLGYSND